jgi:hypothetical protein
MTDLFHALRSCHAKGGWISGVKRADDQYDVTLYKRDDTPIGRVALTYDGFRQVFDYWQQLERSPLSGKPWRKELIA